MPTKRLEQMLERWLKTLKLDKNPWSIDFKKHSKVKKQLPKQLYFAGLFQNIITSTSQTMAKHRVAFIQTAIENM